MRNRRYRRRCLAILAIALHRVICKVARIPSPLGEARSAVIVAYSQREEIAQGNPRADNEEKHWLSFAYAFLVVRRMHNAETLVVASVTHSDIACDVLPPSL